METSAPQRRTGLFKCPGKPNLNVIGEELVSWKRRVESWITSQSSTVKINFSLGAILGIILGGFAFAQVNSNPDQYALYSANGDVCPMAIRHQISGLLVASKLDASDDYIQEVFGSPLPSRMTEEETALKAKSAPSQSPPPSILNSLSSPLSHLAENPLNSLVSRMGSHSLLWPMRGGTVSSRFGMRWGRMHEGTDIAAPYGTSILAAADGKVIFSGWQGGYGNLIILDHGSGVKTKYGHCSQRLVAVGEHVHQGDILGKVGSTGHSTGPHLHYEVLREGLASNPEAFTRRR
jgi:Peptidase family M23